MAINDKDFYASHGLDFDYKNMLDEYIKGVINQAKIEVLTELQTEIEELPMYYDPLDISDLIQQKIDKLKENKMVIIKHGTAYKELDRYPCICPKCDCEFEYVVKRDVHSYLNEECYVICPECFSDIKLPNVSAADIED